MTKVNPDRTRDHEYAKVRSNDMTALLTVDNALIENNPDSPAVNKRNIKAMQQGEKAEAVAENLYRIADVIDSEITRDQLKHATAVDLDDVKAVKERTKQYFISCAEAKHPPSVLTYCSIGLGMTRPNIDRYFRKHNNETTDFISRVFDLIADAISTGALYNNLDNIMAIFQLKNLHGFADNVRIEAAAAPQAPEVDKDALAKEYEAYAKEHHIRIPKDNG